MATCDLSGKFFEEAGNIISEEIIYGMETEFDYQGGLIGACEQVCEETVQTTDGMSNSLYTLPEYVYTFEEDNYLNIQNTEEVVANNYQDNFTCDDYSGICYSCEVCGRRFSIKINLDNHMSLHQNERLHNCNFCSISFTSKSELSAHMKTHASCKEVKVNEDCNNNPGEETKAPVKRSKSKIKCPDCNSRFDEAAFGDHVCAHDISSEDDEKSDRDFVNLYYCNLCNRDFVNKTELNRHLMSHRKKMSCNICNEKFTNQDDLFNHCSLHKKTKTGEKIFDCKECGKIFASRSSQQIHARVHSGERPYGCNFCDRAFADGGTLRKHERIHTGEKPYVCLICMRAFNQRVVLRDHVKSHHISVDPNYADTKTPYCCKICKVLFSTAEEFHKDIVKHCDENTARRRQPQIGPRKYKKRKSQSSDENFNAMEVKTEGVKKKRGRKSKLEMQLLMEDWKNTVFMKEELETRTQSDHKLKIFPGGEINRPRTKNVSRPPNDSFRFTPATFSDPKEEFEEISAAVESIKVKMEAFDRLEVQGENSGRKLRRKIKEEM